MKNQQPHRRGPTTCLAKLLQGCRLNLKTSMFSFRDLMWVLSSVALCDIIFLRAHSLAELWDPILMRSCRSSLDLHLHHYCICPEWFYCPRADVVLTMLCLIDICSVFVSTRRVQVCELQHKREILPVWLFSHIFTVYGLCSTYCKKIQVTFSIFRLILIWFCGCVNACIGHISMRGTSVASCSYSSSCRGTFVDMTHS